MDNPVRAIVLSKERGTNAHQELAKKLARTGLSMLRVTHGQDCPCYESRTDRIVHATELFLILGSSPSHAMRIVRNCLSKLRRVVGAVATGGSLGGALAGEPPAATVRHSVKTLRSICIEHRDGGRILKAGLNHR